MNKKILTAILISIALPGSMLSAPADSLRLKSYKLDEVVVTGTRNETDIRHLPMTISVVGRQQLEQTYQPSILPTLTEQVPGLFTTSRGIMGYGVSTGAAGGMSLRGIGAGVNAAGGPTTSLLVLIDGHPQYMGLMGHPIADAYQSMMAERVEVLRGPASVLYGSNGRGYQHRHPQDAGGRGENQCADRIRFLQYPADGSLQPREERAFQQRGDRLVQPYRRTP